MKKQPPQFTLPPQQTHSLFSMIFVLLSVILPCPVFALNPSVVTVLKGETAVLRMMPDIQELFNYVDEVQWWHMKSRKGELLFS